MRKDLIKIQPLRSSFLSCEKDTEAILKALFVESKPYSDYLKRLLLINEPDCLDMTNQEYQKYIDSYSLGKLLKEGYVRLDPKIKRTTFENVKSYIYIYFDDFAPSKNPEFRDATIYIMVVCYLDEWVLDDYIVRPLKICGFIDGILNSLTDKNKKIFNSKGNNIKLSGFGEYEFMACVQGINNEDISLYTLAYRGTHFTEDNEKFGEVEKT